MFWNAFGTHGLTPLKVKKIGTDKTERVLNAVFMHFRMSVNGVYCFAIATPGFLFVVHFDANLHINATYVESI